MKEEIKNTPTAVAQTTTVRGLLFLFFDSINAIMYLSKRIKLLRRP